MIHGIAPDARCPYGMSFKLSALYMVVRCSNTRKKPPSVFPFPSMNRYFHVISALIFSC